MFSVVAVTNLHSQKQSRRIPFVPHPLPLLLSVVLWRMAILNGVCWYVFVVWICSSLIFSDVKHLFTCLQEQKEKKPTVWVKLTSWDWPLEGQSSFELLFDYRGITSCLIRKESAYNARDRASLSGSGRSPGKGHGNPLQYSCLENFMDRGA